MQVQCPHCQSSIDADPSQAKDLVCPACGSSIRLDTGGTGAWLPSEAPRRLGKFEFLEQLGTGTFGTVYKARDLELDRLVAIKIPRAGHVPRAEDLDRFLREARSVAQLKHPGIVAVHDAGRVDGTLYLVSEFVQGATLAERLTAGRMSFRQAAVLAAEVAEALQYAHERGVVHRDIKPSNVMVDLEGKPHVMDFGLAKRAAEEAGMTLEGQVLGTPAYMSPEQARGEVRKVDARSDVYSLGVVLYEQLTGELPFRGQVRMLMVQVMQEEPRPPRKLNDRIPKDLETVCLKAMAKEPGRRYQTAGQLADDLHRWLKGEPILARPVGRVERLWRWARRNPLVAGLTAAVFVLLAAVAGVASVGYVQTKLALNGEAEQREAAETAEGQAKEEAERARAAEQKVRQHLYAAKINLMQSAWDSGQVARLRALLAETEDYPDRGFEWYYWQRLCHLELHTLIGHRGLVTAVSWSPDGRRLATASYDGTAKVWQASSGRELFTLERHTGTVFSVSWSPDGQRLATGGADGTAKVWEAAGGREFVTLHGHGRGIASVSWSPESKRLAAGDWDGTVKVWDVAGRRELLTLKGGPSVSWSPDGKRLATAIADGTVKVWDATVGLELLALKGHTGAVNAVSWSPDGKRLATGSWDGTAKVWDVSGRRELLSLKVSTDKVWTVCWSPDGIRLATGSGDVTAKIWDTSGGRELVTLKGHTTEVASVSWSPDGQRLATGSFDGTAKVWDAAGDRELVTLRGHTQPVLCISWSSDGCRLATGSTDGTAKVWDAAGKGEPVTLKAHADWVNSVSWSPDGTQLATASEDGMAKVWTAPDGRKLLALKGRRVCWSPDGTRLATASEEGTAIVWDAVSGQPLFPLKGHKSAVASVAWSPDGTRLATGSADGTAKVWEAAGGGEPVILEGHTGAISSVSWSPHSKRLATGSWDGTAKVWEAAGGPALLTLRGVSSVSWSPDGKRLATESGDGTVKVWDASGGRELLTLKGGGFLSWSPDGKRLATGSGDSTVKVWEAANAEAVQEWARQDRAVEKLNAGWDPKAPGFVQTWLLLLPLPLASGESGAEALDRQQLPDEAQLRPQLGQRVQVGGRELVWREHQSPGAVLDFNQVLGRVTDQSVAYAVCYLESDQVRHDLWLQVGSDDECKIYINGRKIYDYPMPRSLWALDKVGPVELKQGTNLLVFKVVNETYIWQGCVRLVDREDRPVQDIRVTLTPGE